MLNKMRRRMILAAMTAFAVVMALIVAAINIVNYSAVKQSSVDMLEKILRYEEERGVHTHSGEYPLPFSLEMSDQEAGYMTRIFSVRYDEEGELAFLSLDFIASVDSDKAEEYAEQALGSGRETGVIDNYRYMLKKYDDHTLIAFLNVSRERRFNRTLLLRSLAVAGGSLVLVYILVWLFSKEAIKPFVKNIEKQKRFITDAGHELKTPLTSISASLDVLELEHEGDEWISNIRGQTNRMVKMVGELVTLSRLDEDNPIPDKEVFSLSEAAWETLEVFGAHAETRGKKLDVEIEPDVSLNGDKPAVQQLMSVLLDNAVKYSDEGGKIRFSVRKINGKAVIEVFNTCDYETPPDTERLFDRFYRPDESRSVDTGGTGVGLAIAKAVTETHGGRIAAICPDGKSMTIKAVF